MAAKKKNDPKFLDDGLKSLSINPSIKEPTPKFLDDGLKSLSINPSIKEPTPKASNLNEFAASDMKKAFKEALGEFKKESKEEKAKKSKERGEEKLVDALEKLAVSPGKLLAHHGIGSIFSDMDQLLRRSQSLNLNITDNLSREMRGVATDFGVGMQDFGLEVAGLREQGIKQLSRNTLLLIARFKATDQNTEVLSDFLGRNAVALMISNSQASLMGRKFETVAANYNQRADQLLNSIIGIAKTFEKQTVGGQGQGLIGAFGELQAKLGQQSSDALGKVSKLLADTANSFKLDAFGVGSLIEGLYDSQGGSRESLEKLILMIDDQLAGLGTGSGRAGNLALQNLIESLGGDALISIRQLAFQLRQSSNIDIQLQKNELLSRQALQNAYLQGMERIGLRISQLVGFLGKNGNTIATTIISYTASFVVLSASIRLLAKVIGVNTASQRFNRVTSLFGFLATAGMAIWEGIEYLNGESNKKLDKIADHTDPNKSISQGNSVQNSLLSILADVSNRMSSNTNTKESLELTRQTLMELRKINAHTDPQNKVGDTSRTRR